jgi:hypothetical protein
MNFRQQIAGGENTMINQLTRYMLDDVQGSFPTSFPNKNRICRNIRRKLLCCNCLMRKANVEKYLQNAKELVESYLQNVFFENVHGIRSENFVRLYAT